MKPLLTFTLLLLGQALYGQNAAPRPPVTFSYQDEKTSHTVKISYLSRTTIAFVMVLLNKKTGKRCAINGQAKTEKGGSTEAPQDENGNLYLAIAYNYYNGPNFISFQVELPSKNREAKRLQISATTAKELGSCDYSSDYYILTKVK